MTLDALIAEIGVDAARYFLVARSHDTTVDLDLALARQAHEREPGLLRPVRARPDRGGAREGRAPDGCAEALAQAGGGRGPLHPSERALLKRLLAFGGEVAEAAERRAPHRIAAYALELAQDFTAFYRDCRVVGAEPAGTESFRIALSSPPSGRSSERSTCSGERADRDVGGPAEAPESVPGSSATSGGSPSSDGSGVEADELVVEAGRVEQVELALGRAGASRGGVAPSPAAEADGEDDKEEDDHHDGDDVDGKIEAAAGGKREHTGSELDDERVLDLGGGHSLVDHRLDTGALAVGLG